MFFPRYVIFEGVIEHTVFSYVLDVPKQPVDGRVFPSGYAQCPLAIILAVFSSNSSQMK